MIGYKLHWINAKNDAVKFELYNLDDDPYEKNDLSAANLRKVKSMTTQIEAWQKSVIFSLNSGETNEVNSIFA